MRAVLLASATATTKLGRRWRSPITHGSALVAFERSKLALAPLIRSRRKYGLPRLDIPPRRCLPPVEFCRGTRPSHLHEHNGCGARGLLQRSNGCCGNGENDLWRKRDQFSRVFSGLLGITCTAPSIIDPHGAADNPSCFLEPLVKCRHPSLYLWIVCRDV